MQFVLVLQFTLLIGFILAVLLFGSSLPFNSCFHLMHACHSFLAHPSVCGSHCIPAFHLGHVHLFNYASLWIMLVNCFMLVLQFCLSFCSCLLCALYSLLVPSLSSGFYLPFSSVQFILFHQFYEYKRRYIYNQSVLYK